MSVIHCGWCTLLSRRTVKEALSYKFAGLEELGEKMCIIGELGKLVIEEIPLDETPAGYGRVPYTGFAKTESAVEEAGRCVSLHHSETSTNIVALASQIQPGQLRAQNIASSQNATLSRTLRTPRSRVTRCCRRIRQRPSRRPWRSSSTAQLCARR